MVRMGKDFCYGGFVVTERGTPRRFRRDSVISRVWNTDVDEEEE
jgi:hypothetical protein